MGTSLMQKCMAECLGVYILCSFGNGAVAQTLLYSKDVTAGLLDIHLGRRSKIKIWDLTGSDLIGHDNLLKAYGMAVTLAVYVVGKVSGGHINPAITIAECVFGNFPWAHAPHYIMSQVKT